ncbi:proteasome activator complex subunit 3-like [Convolutriloba macropyga]|uniref:proteasome activator complex subunit 3-like n=1 Tax=Convolutriloba macropyga TaxID=536237 RepID=UPI003F5215C7
MSFYEELEHQAADLLRAVFPENARKLNEQIEMLSEDERLRMAVMRSNFSSRGPAEGAVDPIERLRNKVRTQIQTLAGECGTLNMWISLKKPKIEGGNNFGVAIQKGVVRELQKVTDYCNKVSLQISTHETTRASQVRKTKKYPEIEDYRLSLEQCDEMEFYDLKEVTTNLRNFYLLLADIIVKNYGKILQPKSVKSSANMY